MGADAAVEYGHVKQFGSRCNKVEKDSIITT
jgi:hypothetical protein